VITLDEKKFTILIVGTPSGDIPYIHEAGSIEEAEKEARQKTEELGGESFVVFEEKLLEVV
jgi:hypothetical protein